MFNSITTMFSKGALQALQSKSFAIYAPFSFLAANAYWIQKIAMQWLVWEITHSYAWLGAVALCEAITIILVMPFGGALADFVDRRKIAIATRTLTATIFFLVGIATHFGFISLPLILVFVAILGFSDGFWVPTRLSLVPNLVRREHLSPAISFEATSFHLSQFIGPALAGLIIATQGVAYAFITSSVLITGLIMAFTVIKLRPRTYALSNDSMLNNLRAGVRYLIKNKGMLRLLLFASFAGLCLRPYRDFYAGFSDEIFSQGAQGLAMLASFSGMGAVVATLYIGSLNTTRYLTRRIIVMACIAVSSMLIMAMANSFYMALAASAGLGFSLTGFGTCAQILIQNSVEDSKRGRVMSLWGLQVRAIPSIGGFLLGTLGSLTNIQFTLGLSALLFVLLALTFVWPKRGQIAILEQI